MLYKAKFVLRSTQGTQTHCEHHAEFLNVKPGVNKVTARPLSVSREHKQHTDSTVRNSCQGVVLKIGGWVRG